MTWTDERIGDLSKRVNYGFEQVDKRFEQVDKRFEQVDRRFERVEADIKALNLRLDVKFDAITARFERLDRILIGGLGAVILTMLGGHFF
jgi:hypothetical protein